MSKSLEFRLEASREGKDTDKLPRYKTTAPKVDAVIHRANTFPGVILVLKQISMMANLLNFCLEEAE